jgi:DegV family protein with EDD domain
LGEIRIVVDSSADLPPELVQEWGITIVPLVVSCGDRSYLDMALSREEFWRLAKGPVPCTTSQPPLGSFQEVFQRLVDLGHRVLCLTITGRHSGTFSTAWSAAQPFGDRVTVFDSLSLSRGLGWQALTAARMSRQGALMEQILDALRSIQKRTHILILLETLEALRRGGRAARLMPVVDRIVQALHIKPILHMPEGELGLLGVARSYAKGLERIKQEIARLGPLEYLAVMHVRREALAQQFADELARLLPFARERITVGEAGVVLACHAGEGVVAAIGVQAG